MTGREIFIIIIKWAIFGTFYALIRLCFGFETTVILMLLTLIINQKSEND